MIPYGRQDISDTDVESVVAVLRSDFLTQGPAIPRFEEVVASAVLARFAVAVNSATSALHIACLALDLGPGELLWTVPNTFVASANCARYCGADVDFVDIDPVTWNISVEKLREKLIDARRLNRLPKVLVAVHFAGQPTAQEEIRELAHEYGFRVIEDASHAIGAAHRGEPVGSCKWSDITIFSFHPVKIITTAEGGMALTQDPVLAGRMRLLRSHGITREAGQLTVAQAPAWYYEQQALGFNYRLTDLQAALGISQAQRLHDYVARRNVLARRYAGALINLPLRLPAVLEGNLSAFHLYVVRLQGAAALRHREVFDAMRARGISVNLHYTPVHLQPYYRALGFHEGQFPEAEAHGAEALTLPLYPTLTEDEQDVVIDTLRAVL